MLSFQDIVDSWDLTEQVSHNFDNPGSKFCKGSTVNRDYM